MNGDIHMLLDQPTQPPEQVREERKKKLTAALRLFGKYGFDEGVAGHISVRDPEYDDYFWVNPMGVSFKQITLSQLLLVNHQGEVVEGSGYLNGAAFTIHSHIHKTRPDIVAAAHAHSIYGKSWSSLGRLLDPITQDACAFYRDHGLLDTFSGVVLEMGEGEALARALGPHKALILQNHGLLTVGKSVDEAAWWYITMEKCCRAQLLAEAAGQPILIDPEVAIRTRAVVGTELAGLFSFQSLYQVICAEQPDMFA
ncbi:class II aldolase/adducin family protein [Microbulbifer sp. ZKSA006]|uniref:class II aldolase/adducin family protein n=1 Tax=Microbulbifer sp. ZKSA006 TaxID=3243390 RepID=UPI004039E703